MFKDHFIKFTNRIFKDKIPTAWARYADGEKMIILGENVGQGTQAFNIDHWSSYGKTQFSLDLYNTLFNIDENYFYAISCKCCDSIGNDFYTNTIVNKNISYANLWINSNYQDFVKLINTIEEDVVLIANKEGIDKTYPFNVIKYFPIEYDIVNYYNQNKELIISQLKEFCDFRNKLVLISAGPLSEIIIDILWSINKTNRYIDIGSSIGNYIHRQPIRTYMSPGDNFAERICYL